jgi:hypothetical protein
VIRAYSSSLLLLVASALLAVACGSVAGLQPPESGDGSADVGAGLTPPEADSAANDSTASGGPDGSVADATKSAPEDAASAGDAGNSIDGADATLVDGANDAAPADATTLDAEATKDAPTTCVLPHAGLLNGAGGAELIAYDQAHFTSVGQTVLAGDDEDTRVRLVRWGRYGFAFASNSGAQVSIVRTSIVPPQP